MEEKEKKKLEDAKTKDKGNCDRLMANDFVDAQSTRLGHNDFLVEMKTTESK